MARGDRRTELTRDELYAQVWAEPMTKLAQRYGLSDRGLAKMCDRMGIPTPGRGYWAKVQSGHTMKQSKLPSLKAGQQDKVILDARGKIEDESEELPAEIAFEQDPVNRIVVPEELDKPHTLVRKTAKSLRGARADDYGMVRPRVKDCLDVRIGKGSIDRVSRILDALIKALEVRGIELVQGEKEDDCLRMVVDGETLGFSLEETARRERYQPTPAEKRALAKDPYYRWRLPSDTFTPSGVLSLKLESRWWSRGLRCTWTDGKRQRVEDRLNQFIATAYKSAAQKKADRIRSEIEARERAERERQREILKQQIVHEQGRVDVLTEQAKAWQAAQQLRDYVQAARSAGYYAQSAITDGLDLNAWCDWALDQASRLDPTVSSPPSVLDYKDQFFWR
jgi:hypothetical protein